MGYRKLGFDLTIIDEDSVSTANNLNPLDNVIKAENKKNDEYEDFFTDNGYFVVPIGITTRGVLGQGANETLDLLIEFSKRKRKKLNLGHIKKEIMCSIKKSESSMIEFFSRQLKLKIRPNYIEK
jgi:hypothetical protein